MSILPKDYLEKVYAGFLGMNMGIRIGAPVESTVWTYDKIKATYGDIRGYVKDYKNFAADDDVNGPVFFLRALNDDARDRELETEDVGRAWLNYAREGIGMFWWGGYGVSTEHTAYLNLKSGMSAKESGSAKQNGIILAEQIGGQIFIDTWGLIWPNNMEKAAEYGEKAARVSHDRNGVYGARFMTACIAKAFGSHNVMEIIEAGLSVIPADSTYANMVNAVIEFHQEHPDDFRLCRAYLEENWGYDKYLGVCHIIPNAGVCVLALLYGEGDLSRTIEIATMCGWDTDCNAGNVGTIMGVAQGIQGLKDHYRAPINDSVVTSSISGYLNMIDIPTYTKELALLGYRMAKEEPPRELVESFVEGEIYFDFDLPGSTHNFRLSNNFSFRLKHSDEIAYKGSGSLEILFDRVTRGQSTKVYYKPFYRRSDFNDERYKPTFAPKVYSGQTVSMKVYLDQWQGGELVLCPYVRNTYNQEEIKLTPVILENKMWNDITFTVPDTQGAMIDEVGLFIESFASVNDRALGRLFIDEFRVHGKAKYTINFSKQAEEFLCVTPFAHNHGAWNLEGDRMHVMCIDNSEAYTGNYFTKDVSVKAIINPQNGYSHNLAVRAQGAMRGYHVGFSGPNQVSFVVNDFGFQAVFTVAFQWEYDKDYQFEVIARGTHFEFFIDGDKVLAYDDSKYAYGMFGFSKLDTGRAYFSQVEVEEL